MALTLFFSLLYGEYIYGEENGREQVEVLSQTMEFDSNRRLMTFTGDVVAKEDFTLCSDRLYVQYGEDERIEKIIAEDRVRLVQGNRGARGDRAVYYRKDRFVVITGSAEALECGDVVRGDKITFYLDTDDVFVESIKGGRVRATIMPEKKDCTGVAIGELLKCP